MNQFVALMYHGLREHPKGEYSVALSEFEKQLQWLKGEGFVIEGFPELEARLVCGDIPQRYVVMTFDDGHKGDLRTAETLRKIDSQATFFLTKEFCQHVPGFLPESEIRELSTLCSIGSHGVTHLPLIQISTEQMQWELAESKKCSKI